MKKQKTFDIMLDIAIRTVLPIVVTAILGWMGIKDRNEKLAAKEKELQTCVQQQQNVPVQFNDNVVKGATTGINVEVKQR